MSKDFNPSRDGAEPVPWGDYVLHLLLLAAAFALVVLRVVGAVHWSWWVVLIPSWALIAVFAASVLAAVMHSD